MIDLLGSHLIGFIAVVIYVFLATLCLRLRGCRGPIGVVFIAAIPTYLAFPLFLDSLKLVAYSATFFFGAMVFLFFWGGLYKSISARIICDLYSSPEKCLSVDNIYEQYLLKESFKGRLEMLLDNKYLVKDDDNTYLLTAKGENFAARVKFIQLIYKINFSG